MLVASLRQCVTTYNLVRDDDVLFLSKKFFLHYNSSNRLAYFAAILTSVRLISLSSVLHNSPDERKNKKKTPNLMFDDFNFYSTIQI